MRGKETGKQGRRAQAQNSRVDSMLKFHGIVQGILIPDGIPDFPGAAPPFP